MLWWTRSLTPYAATVAALCLAGALAALLSPPVSSHAAVNAQAGGICNRTEAVRVALVDLVDYVHPTVAGCADVTDAHLAAITGRLNLSFGNIHSLQVGDFDGLTHLKILDLRRNQLRTLPDGVFAGLDSLVRLDLWQNELQTLPAGTFAGLSALSDLDMEENDLRTLLPGVFAGLNLRFLGLEGNRLRTLPSGVFDDLDVTLTLDLSHNELHALPSDVFSGLTNLGLLDLSVNRLRVLPPGLFSGLTSMTGLWLDQNPGSLFTFTMMPKLVPGTNKLVVTVAQGAPFPMDTTLIVTGGTPPASMLTVTVPTGRTASDEIVMTSLGGAMATLSGAPPVSTGDERDSQPYFGIGTAVGEPVTFFDTTSGAVTITSDPGPDDTYAAGDDIDLTVTFAENTTVDTADGTPQIGLTIGTTPKLAGYTSGSGTASLVFRYTVAEGDLDTDGVSTGSGSITGHKVDGVKPVLLSATVDGAALTLTYSEAVRGSSAPLASAYTVAGGQAGRSVSNVAATGSVVALTLNPPVGQPETGLTLSYTAPATGQLRDLAGNDAEGFSGNPVQNDTPDTTAPTVTGVALASYPDTNGTYALGDAIEVTVTFDEPVRVTGTPQLLLRVGNHDRTARYHHGMGKALLFAYTVVEDDADTDGVSIAANQLSLNGGAIKDAGGNAGVLAHQLLLPHLWHKVNGMMAERPPPPPELSPTPDPSPTPAPPTPPLPVPQTLGGAGGGGGFGPAPVAPSFVDGFRTNRAVAENARPGDAVGEPVAASHPDELEVTYSLSGTDAASFAVDEETGQISVKEGMDLTIGMTYTVNLTATDSAGFGAIVIVMIEVTEASFSPYDLNGNDAIERDEVIMAIRDYFSGEITKGDVIELIKLYFAEPG